jgi:ATP-dependent Clp protease ATP-binding subunit ClpA
MTTEFEFQHYVSYDKEIPLEAQIPTDERQQIGRHMAEKAFLDGFFLLDEPESLFETMRATMKQQIIDQPLAIDTIISALDRWDVRGEKDNRPIANLAFLGPTGVGKSQTAKVLADLLSNGEGNLVKIDCSNYSNGFEVASLTGAPPGYVGREQEALLSKKNIEAPGTVVLFDEVEKGSEKLWNQMLQIMGDGELRINNGDVTSFRDAIIILTSNLGAEEMGAQMSEYPIGFGDRVPETNKTALEKTAMKAFNKNFRPEFINRLDKQVVFHPLSSEGMARVLLVKLDEINTQYEGDFGVRISLSDATIAHLVATANKEPHLGARPVVRAFEENIQTAFGRYNGSRGVSEGTHIRVFHRNELPEDYPRTDDRELIFAAKPDETIKRRVSKEIVLFSDATFEYDTSEMMSRSPEDDPTE